MGNELSTDPQMSILLRSVLRAEIAKLDQGEHEMEVVCGDNMESDINRHMERCKKHPGHKDFIPVNKLTLNHVPAPWRHPNILATIEFNSDKTVRLFVCYTSPDRPSSLPYGNLKDRLVPRFGTGWCDVGEISDISQPCPLKDCSFSSAPHKVSPFFVITTAAHVVYDDSEAEKTVVEFFYDDEKDRSSVMKAEGVNINDMDLNGDVCYINCVTHDPDWRQQLQRLEIIKQAEKRKGQPRFKYPHSPLAFIVSHPHGASKHVTFGDVIYIKHIRSLSKEDMDGSKKLINAPVLEQPYAEIGTECWFKHKIPTCPGSSGAPTCMLAYHWDRGTCIFTSCGAPHSRHKISEQVNESGVGAVAFSVV